MNKLDEMDSLESTENKLNEEEIHSALEKLRRRKKKFESLYSRIKKKTKFQQLTQTRG